MTLWKLEWMRLVRSKRLVALVVVYVFFGLLGPLTARYIGEIVERFGGDVQVTFPDPVPADGIAQYLGNASQIGILVAVAIAAGALVLDALPEMSIFLRTRVQPVGRILIPRLVVVTIAITGAYLLGLAMAWYETAVLLGGLPVGGMLAGAVLSSLYLGFAVAVVAAFGARSRSVVGTVGLAVVVLLVMPLLGVVDAIGRWLPSHLVGAQVGLVTGESIVDHLPAAAVTIAASAGLIALAFRTAGSREL